MTEDDKELLRDGIEELCDRAEAVVEVSYWPDGSIGVLSLGDAEKTKLLKQKLKYLLNDE